MDNPGSQGPSPPLQQQPSGESYGEDADSTPTPFPIMPTEQASFSPFLDDHGGLSSSPTMEPTRGTGNETASTAKSGRASVPPRAVDEDDLFVPKNASSSVWKIFRLSNSNPDKAICLKCYRWLAYSSNSTSTLHKHLRSFHVDKDEGSHHARGQPGDGLQQQGTQPPEQSEQQPMNAWEAPAFGFDHGGGGGSVSSGGSVSGLLSVGSSHETSMSDGGGGSARGDEMSKQPPVPEKRKRGRPRKHPKKEEGQPAVSAPLASPPAMPTTALASGSMPMSDAPWMASTAAPVPAPTPSDDSYRSITSAPPWSFDQRQAPPMMGPRQHPLQPLPLLQPPPQQPQHQQHFRLPPPQSIMSPQYPGSGSGGGYLRPSTMPPHPPPPHHQHHPPHPLGQHPGAILLQANASPSSSPSFEQDSFHHRAVVGWCLRDLQPLSCATKPGFVTMARSLNPRFNPPSLDMLKEALHRLNDASITQTRSLLGDDQAFKCLKANVWKGDNDKTFLAVMVLVVKRDFRLKQKSVHGSRETAAVLRSVIALYGLNLTSRAGQGVMIHSVVTDDHPDLVSAMGTLVPSFVVCTIRLLQQTMQQGLETCVSFQPLFRRCRRLIHYFNSHPPLAGLLAHLQQASGLTPSTLKDEGEFSFNGTYLMLDSLLRVQVFVKACSDPSWAGILPPSVRGEEGEVWLSPREWEDVEAVAAVLRPFEESAKILASEPFQPLSLVCPLVVKLRQRFEERSTLRVGPLLERNITEAELTPGARELRAFYRQALMQRWLDSDGVYSTQYLVASLLDPRFKTLPFLTLPAEREKAWRALVSVYSAIKGLRTDTRGDVLPAYIQRLAEHPCGPSGPVMPEGPMSGNEWLGNTAMAATSMMASAMMQSQDEEREGAGGGGGKTPQPLGPKQSMAPTMRGGGGGGAAAFAQTPESFEELEYYRSLPAVGMTESALEWWQTRRQTLPTLSILTAQFLGISATSWDVQRFAKAAGPSLACLQAEMPLPDLEMFVTLHENWDDGLFNTAPFSSYSFLQDAGGGSGMSVSSQGSSSFAYGSQGTGNWGDAPIS